MNKEETEAVIRAYINKFDESFDINGYWKAEFMFSKRELESTPEDELGLLVKDKFQQLEVIVIEKVRELRRKVIN